LDTPAQKGDVSIASNSGVQRSARAGVRRESSATSRPLTPDVGHLHTTMTKLSPILLILLLAACMKLHLVQLRELILFDNCNYSDLRAVEHLLNLETLCLEGGFSKHLSVHSLGPLSALRPLRRLRLASIRAVEDGLRPLATLANLREVFIAATFGSTELQFLAQALPDAKGEFLDSYR
jgi:hypothetical protein